MRSEANRKKSKDTYNALIAWLKEHKCKEPVKDAYYYCNFYGIIKIRRAMNDIFCISVKNLLILLNMYVAEDDKKIQFK